MSLNELCCISYICNRQEGIRKLLTGMSFADLTMFVLNHISANSMKHALGTACEGRGVPVSVYTVTTGFDAEEPDGLVLCERVKHSYGVAAAAYAGDDGVGQFAFQLLHLFFRFIANDGLECAHNRRVWMRTDSGSDDIMCRWKIDYPGTKSFVNGVTESTGAGFDSYNFGA